MRCQEIRRQLSVYRELNRSEQNRVQEHLAGCPSCAATLAAYQRQDHLLSSLPVLRASPHLAAAVHTRTVGRRRVMQPSWRLAAAALSLVLCFTIVGGTVSSATEALPGDLLYPIKRGVEELRLALTLDAASREQYRTELADTRREEVRQVIHLSREALVEFEGDLVAIRADVWEVDGFQVSVSPQAWAGQPPPTGSILLVQAQATGGQLKAGQVRVLEPAAPIPEPQVSPTAPPWPSPTPSEARRTEPPGGEPHASVTPGAWSPGSQPSATPRDWGPGLQPSATPGTWGPGPQPSVTPGEWGPGPQPSVTLGEWRPGPEPSATPKTWGPGPQPSVTPNTWGPGPQPSATPNEWGPGPQPSVTPNEWGPGPQPSVTPSTWGPGPQPSVTPNTRGPGAQPSATPSTWGPGPQPSVTPRTGGR